MFVLPSSVHRLDCLFTSSGRLGFPADLRTQTRAGQIAFHDSSNLAVSLQNVELNWDQGVFIAADPRESFGPAGDLSPADRELLLAAYSSTAGLGIIDRSFRYIWVNEELARMHNRPAADHIGKSVKEILGELANLKEPPLRRVMQTGDPLLNVDISGVLAGRGPVSWRQHYFPLKDTAGNVTRIGITSTEVAVKTAQGLDQELNREKNRRQILAEITDLLAANWDLPVVFPAISARLRRLFQQEVASVSLYDPKAHVFLRQGIDFPFGKGLLASAPVSATNSPGERALKKRAPLIFSKQELESFDSEIAKVALAEGMQSLCCVPMMRPNGPMGMLVLGSTREKAFEEEDLSLLSQVAAQLALTLENHRAASEIQRLRERLGEERKHLEHEIRTNKVFPEIVGDGPALRQVLDQVITVAESEATVLLLGETGTGKELIARAVHRLSGRKAGPFIKLNCAAIPTGLLESELFGHEKGAFTGAISQKIGRMELADGGTLFLDEIGEIPLELQPKLLRGMQDQEFERLGSNRTIKVDVRLIAATNRDLAERVAQHQFRSDLYYRLNVFPIVLPPLRERREDIPLLVRYFVTRFARKMGRHIEVIPTGVMEALKRSSWPGNVRELENLMERAVILSEGSALRVPLTELRISKEPIKERNDDTLDWAERQHIIRVLRETGGRIAGPDGAAKRLGLKRTTLQSKMQRLKISREDYSSGPEP